MTMREKTRNFFFKNWVVGGIVELSHLSAQNYFKF